MAARSAACRAKAGVSVTSVRFSSAVMASEYSSAQASGMSLGDGAVLVRSQDVVAGTPTRVAYDALAPASPSLILITALGVLALVFVAGFGWARSAISHPVDALALAPAFGAAALLLGAIVFERLGLALTWPGAAVISAVVAAGGYALWWWRRHRFLREIREGQPVAEATS